ncbi:hypothetical protein LZ009_10415 [Ramlibacter sp. XY19]|uniref:hypothetical protein n=1 Tax=Ramlibacter paludis TaxID=2908000 RepID=UPI0023DA2EEE|nr:hypothetical protein [Ramlibacter paludis]MCG2593193.1 hypothetical protein [Ramlibacter paludis]
MATPLLQYWTDEVNRLTALRALQQPVVTAARAALTGTKAVQQTASDAVRTQALALETARLALAGIPMPADGNPLLLAMETALIGLAEAQATLASTGMAVQTQAADLARKEAQLAATEAALEEAESESLRELDESTARQGLASALLTGNLATLAADAAATLATFEATARSRVEGEFPTNATNAKSFIKRVRDRREMVRESARAATDVETAALTAANSALALASRRFQRATLALRAAADAAPRVDADASVLARLAGLPAPTATTFPILTAWQRDRLHDSTKKAARETALAKVAAIDAAVAAVRPAQQAYDIALHAAMKADPDKTQAQLDAGAVATERAALDAKITAVATAHAAITVAELDVVKSWFASVPQPLWDALEKLDLAVSRLTALSGSGSPATVLAELTAAETAFAAALGADRLATRKVIGAALALDRASTMREAEQETVGSRANAYAHSAALF